MFKTDMRNYCVFFTAETLACLSLAMKREITQLTESAED